MLTTETIILALLLAIAAAALIVRWAVRRERRLAEAAELERLAEAGGLVAPQSSGGRGEER